jgi:hypothetical protein
MLVHRSFAIGFFIRPSSTTSQNMFSGVGLGEPASYGSRIRSVPPGKAECARDSGKKDEASPLEVQSASFVACIADEQITLSNAGNSQAFLRG